MSSFHVVGVASRQGVRPHHPNTITSSSNSRQTPWNHQLLGSQQPAAPTSMEPHAAIKLLPYIVTLEAPDELMEAMLLEERLYELVNIKNKNSNNTLVSREQLQEARDNTTRLLDKHCRKQSLKLHPDLKGEESRPAFERLVEARNCLRDEELRHLYLEQMLQIAIKVGTDFLESSHYHWVQRHLPTDARAKASVDKQEKQLQLTGGITNDKPRKPSVSIISNKGRMIKVVLHLPNDLYHFYEYCTSIQVVASSGDITEEEIALATIMNLDRLRKQGCQEITKEVQLPVHGIWYVSWFCTFDIHDMLVNTPKSVEAVVDLTSAEQLQKQRALHETDALAGQRAGTILAVLNKLRGANPDHAQVQSRHQMLHSAISRGRSTLNRLISLSANSSSSSNNMAALQEALEVAGPETVQLEAQLQKHQKRDHLKEFKSHVAHLLENGEAASWLQSVSVEGLQKMGGEPNRLYQLLVEGSGVAYKLELDAATLEVASARNDLFTPKQCQTLLKRKQEVEERTKEEAQHALWEAEQEAQLERQRNQQVKAAAALEALRKAQLEALGANSSADSKFPCGTRVVIQGLTSAQGTELNGTSGTVELEQGDRCIVRCDKDFKLRSFPLALVQDKGTNESWACGVCTFLHQGVSARREACDMCQTPRGSNNTPASAGPSSSSTAQPAATTSVPKEKGISVAAENSKSSASKSPRRKAKPLVTARVPTVTTVQTKSTVPKNITETGTHREPKTTAKAAPKSAGVCRNGANCRYLQQGMPCKFYHSPGEIQRAAAGNRCLPISHELVGWVIGKGGCHVKRMMDESGATIWIDKKPRPCLVHISGKPEAASVAARLVTETIDRATPRDKPAQEKSNMPSVSDAAASVAPHGTPTPSDKDTTVPSVADTSVSSMSTFSTTEKPAASGDQQAQPSRPTSAVAPPGLSEGTSTLPRHGQAPRPLVPPPGLTMAGVSLSSQTDASNTFQTITPEPSVPSLVQPQSTRTQLTLHQSMSSLSNQTSASPFNTPPLLAFVRAQKACLKGSPDAFYQWLVESEDITTLEDLAAAVSDDDYLRNELQQGGVKGFKRSAFKKAVMAASSEDDGDDENVPAELLCPISHVLMTDDPVLAADGHTYERSAIEAWFQKQLLQIEDARQELAIGANSLRARTIFESGVLSPMTNTRMPNLELRPNNSVRSMARDAAQMQSM